MNNTKNQFSLLGKLRFAPFFWTQFCGAFNDNIYKNALIILITYQVSQNMMFSINTMVNICAAFFILPYFLFSATAGQLADKYEKSHLIRGIKLLEIFIMLGVCLGFYLQNVWVLVVLLFLLGTQAAFFGPVKYSILPQHLKENELVGGNGLVSMGTFAAILLGTIMGGVLVSLPVYNTVSVSLTLLLIAILGWLFSLKIPKAKPHDPNLKFSLNPFSETVRNLGFARKDRAVFLSILGDSWFWFFGAVFLTQIPNYSKVYLGGNEHLVTLLLVMFCVGLGIGALLCERLSGHKVEIGLVPFGSIGLSVFGFSLYFCHPDPYLGEMMDISQFIQHGHNWAVLVNLIGLGIFGGFFIVPLYAFIQHRSDDQHRSRIIAANNILNAVFMVMSSMYAIFLLWIGVTIPQLFFITAIINIFVGIYIYTLAPEFLMRFVAWFLVSIIYRVKTEGIEEHVPETGAAILICNHVSFFDPIILLAFMRRPVRFVMDHRIYHLPVIHFIFKIARAIPIATSKENPEMKKQALESVAQALENGELVAIFPEGGITRNGEMGAFKSGIEKMIKRTPVPVIPIALRGLWGSFFSRKNGAAMSSWPRRFWSKISLIIGPAIPPEQASRAYLEERVNLLRGEEK